MTDEKTNMVQRMEKQRTRSKAGYPGLRERIGQGERRGVCRKEHLAKSSVLLYPKGGRRLKLSESYLPYLVTKTQTYVRHRTFAKRPTVPIDVATV